MKAVLPAIAFAARHLLVVPVIILAGCVLWTIAYLLYRIYVHEFTTHSMPSTRVILKNFMVFLAVPLGAYWWVTEGPGALFDLFRRWLRKRGGQIRK